jgi:LPS-assembly lipoprotein
MNCCTSCCTRSPSLEREERDEEVEKVKTFKAIIMKIFLSRNMKSAVVLVCSFLLASCGYHLRGAIDLPPAMQNVYIQNGSSPLRAAFKEVLGQLTATPDAAGIIVRVLSERMRRNTLSLTSTGKSTEYELNYYLDVEMFDAEGKVIMPKQSIELRQPYFDTQINVIGKSKEEAIIRQEMYRQAVRSVIDRALSALKAYEI